MDISVIIPTRSRLQQLEDCLRGLLAQDYDARRFEILVGVDGDDDGETDAFARIAGGVLQGGVDHCGGGPAATRNVLINKARGRLLLLLNDDVVPHPALLSRHWQTHAELGEQAMILGSAPWAISQPDRLFDRLIRETSMVFFYDQMTDDDPQRDWGFRHGWTLNLSVTTDAIRQVSGFCEAMNRPVYEDLELAWRLKDRFAMPVLYRPAASVTHVHRYEPLAFLHRDAVLGHQAWRLAEVSPGCAIEMFGNDIRSDDEVEYSRDFLKRHEKTSTRHIPMFLQLAEIPADVVRGPHARSLIAMIYEQGLMLRRYMWRLGHVAAAEGRSIDDAVAWLHGVYDETACR